MVTLFDIMREAQGGRALDLLGREFGLDPSKVQDALGVILPAFSLGLKNSVYNPAAFGPIVDLVASDRYLPYFDGRNVSLGSGAGTDALLRIFGSPEATQRIAEQGSAMAGIGLDIMQRMMPHIAAILIGGLFKHASLEGIGDLLAQWSAAFHRAHSITQAAETKRALKPPSVLPAVNPFEWWSSLLLPGAGKPAAPPAAPPPPSPSKDDPVTSAIDAWGAMVTAMLGAPPAVAPPVAAPPAPTKVDTGAGMNPLQILARMFDVGRDVQAQSLRQWTRLLDAQPRPSTR